MNNEKRVADETIHTIGSLTHVFLFSVIRIFEI